MPKRIAIATWDSLKDLWMREPQAKDQRKRKISLLEHWGVFSETWPTSGMMLDGRVYELPTSEHHTGENECSLLPTPLVTGGKGDSLADHSRNTPQLRATSFYFPC